MAKQTLVQLFGAKAVRSGAKITIDLTDFVSVGLTNATTCSPSQACAAYLRWLQANTKQFAEDSDAGVAAETFDQQRSFTTRDNKAQIIYPVSLNLFSPDNTAALDPDNVI